MLMNTQIFDDVIQYVIGVVIGYA